MTASPWREHEATLAERQLGLKAGAAGPGDHVAVKRMWDGGPFRRWSATKTTHTPMGYAMGGFVGSYVCGECYEPCDGVYLVREEQNWLCGACKEAVRPSRGEQ